MKVGCQDIDPVIARALQQRLAMLLTLHASAAEVAAEVVPRWRDVARRHRTQVLVGISTMFSSVPLASVVAVKAGGSLGIIAFFFLIAFGASLFMQSNQQTKRDMFGDLQPEDLRAAPKAVKLTPPEEAYCSAVAQLLEAREFMDETTLKEIIRQLNSLLENHRRLEAPLGNLRAAMGGQSLDAMEQELDGLERRRDEQEDAGAREAMEQSISMCSDRISHARAMAPGLEKVEAQQEVIMQTFASVQSTFARSRVAQGSAAWRPDGSAQAARPELQELQQSVLRVNDQARAVEEAVREVVAIGR